MITLYRNSKSRTGEQIEDMLHDLALSYNVVHADKLDPDRVRLPNTLPALKDNGSMYEGDKEVYHHIEELEAYKKKWYKYQSDVCYCKDDDEE